MSTEYNEGDFVMLKPLDKISDHRSWIVNGMKYRFGKVVQISVLEHGWGSFRVNDGSGYSWSLSWIESRVGDDLIIN